MRCCHIVIFSYTWSSARACLTTKILFVFGQRNHNRHDIIELAQNKAQNWYQHVWKSLKQLCLWPIDIFKTLYNLKTLLNDVTIIQKMILVQIGMIRKSIWHLAIGQVIYSVSLCFSPIHMSSLINTSICVATWVIVVSPCTAPLNCLIFSSNVAHLQGIKNKKSRLFPPFNCLF